MKQHARYLLLASVLATVLVPSVIAHEGASRQSEAKRRKRVATLAKQTNVNQRQYVDDYFALAEICAKDDRIDEAIAFYEQGLRIDPWRLEHQLALARLFKDVGLKDQAIEKAAVVYRYAEQDDLIDRGKRLLYALDAPVTLPASNQTGRHEATIVLIPIGQVNRRIMAELAAALQERLGIEFAIGDDTMPLGEFGRSHADLYLSLMIESIKTRLSPHDLKNLLTELALTEASLNDPHTQPKFLEAVLKKDGRSKAELVEFRETLARLGEKGQYDAKQMCQKLQQAYPLSESGKIIGYLGITGEDLFADGFNYLYGWGGQGHAVMSYHQFTAEFNQSLPNRPRLVERATKQAISSTFFILGIPRCTSPICARAYPNSLTELDQKTTQLCPACQRELEWTLAKSR